MIDIILKWLGLKKEPKVKEAVKEIAKEEKKKTKKSREKTTKAAKKSGKKTAKKAEKKSKKTKKELIVEYLKKRKKPATVEEVAKAVGATEKTAKRYLYYLMNEGKVEKKDSGWVAK